MVYGAIAGQAYVGTNRFYCYVRLLQGNPPFGAGNYRPFPRWSAIFVTSIVFKIHNHFEEITDLHVNRGVNHPLSVMIFQTIVPAIRKVDG
jgi:hypothetical protein